MLVSIALNRPDEVRQTKWFNLYYAREEFKGGKNNHCLLVEFKSGKFKDFTIVVQAGGDDNVGKDAVYKFANSLPDTVDASYLKSLAKRQGMTVEEDKP